MKLSLLTGLLTATLALPGCLAVSEPVCQSTILVPITTATGPRTATVGQAVTYNLVYSIGNDCGTFGNIVTNTINNTDGTTVQQVGVNGSYTGCSCNATTTSSQTTYQFTPTKAGTYYVQFLTTNNAYLTDTLTVR
ncbi:hypothetical protein HHL22_14610 [Hymenobacter sp. RP-2-7]|uniref:GOLD domain-containing protein n=1 Tax=Hymenobacter polaris TaxID=2682546 RepID=A0A7Y0AFN1_9BACT|nr:hypothetical protein [Hymenobacter polaris]NML66441.1 hypothetical protein [Hymenobacter polaris]